MDRILIGIHGLRNKPAAQILEDWWLLSIRDGVDHIAKPQLPFKFELLYWADLLYLKPSDPFLIDKENPLFLKNPYKRLSYRNKSRVDHRLQHRLERLEKISDQLFHIDRILESFEGISDRFIHSRFHDLEVYLRNGTGYMEATQRPTREVILERLGQLLFKYRRKKIMLIAHSMGSIVAYDLLTQPDNPFRIDTLITMGSPLGQPTIMSKFASENPVVHKLHVPDNVDKWINLSDLKDIVALDPTLADDYAPNKNGVSPVDVVIENLYAWEGVPNPHSAFGYLQSPECAAYIYEFLTKDRPTWAENLAHFVYKIQERLLQDRKKRLQRSASRPEQIPATQ
jgi:hypothetical protein